jgi:gamma-glutamyltranspeptidase/glutathione hydrolase
MGHSNPALENRMPARPLFSITFICLAFLALSATACAENRFAGIVSSASPEATAAGVAMFEQGGNAIDAAVAVSLALGVSEPAGSGIFGQTVMLVQLAPGEEPFVIQGSTYSPRVLPDTVSREQLTGGHTAATVPSTLRVLDFARNHFGSGAITWAQSLAPAIRLAEDGFVVGPFRHRSFRYYSADLMQQQAAREIYVKPDGTAYQIGETFRNPRLAATLRRLASHGADDFYNGEIAASIADDMAANGGWISTDDLARFPEPPVAAAISVNYRGFDVYTLPPPFGGWVALQILNVLENVPAERLRVDDSSRRLNLLDAMVIAHGTRKNEPVADFHDYADDLAHKLSKEQASALIKAYYEDTGGETTHFSIVDAKGMAVSVTQSIDGYFGAKVAHPTLGFLYNNYMQSFRLEDDGSPFVLAANEMPLSSMTATIVAKDGDARLVLGSPGSARIISAVAQVTSHWIDIDEGIESAVGAYRVHAQPMRIAFVEGESLSPELLQGLADRNMILQRPIYGVSDSHYDPYFGGVHALAFENGVWTGATDPRRDGHVGIATR